MEELLAANFLHVQPKMRDVMQAYVFKNKAKLLT